MVTRTGQVWGPGGLLPRQLRPARPTRGEGVEGDAGCPWQPGDGSHGSERGSGERESTRHCPPIHNSTAMLLSHSGLTYMNNRYIHGLSVYSLSLSLRSVLGRVRTAMAS